MAAASALLAASCTATPIAPPLATVESAQVGVTALDRYADSAFTPLAAIDVDGQDLPAVDPASVIDPGTSGTACPAGASIAVAAPLSGDGAYDGKPVLQGVSLAVRQFSAANPSCQLVTKQFDTHDDPERTGVDPEPARQAAADIAADTSIIGMVGPVFSRDMLAMGAILASAGIAVATPSATMPALSRYGWHNFFRGVANEDDWLKASGNFLTRRLAVTQACVINLDEDNYPVIGRQITDILGPTVDPACSATISQDAGSYAPIIESIKAASPDAIYIAADGWAAADLCSAVRRSGVTAKIIGSEGIESRLFIKQSVGTANGVITAGTFQVPTAEYRAAYLDEFGEEPGRYSVEAYELTGIMIEGISTGAVTDRPSMVEWFQGYSGYGAITHYQWNTTGELVTAPVFLREVT